MRHIVIFCFFIFSISCLQSAFASEKNCRCDNDTLLKDMLLRKINAVENYQLNTVVQFGNHEIYSRISGMPPDRLKIVQKISNGGNEIVNLVLFDGHNQWIESNVSGKLQILKIKANEIVNAQRPFDTGYYLMGTGILNGEDFISTVKILLSIYKTSTVCNDNQIVLSGPVNEKALTSYAKERISATRNENHIKQFTKEFGYLRMVLNLSDCLIREYTLGPSKHDPKIKVTFDDLTINNPEINNDIFKYVVPENAEAVDITEEIKRKIDF